MSDFVTDPTNVFRRKLMRITDLATATDVLAEYVFEECDIVGPAVLIFAGDGNQFLDCGFDGPGALWDLDNTRPYIGGIGIRACLFERCTLRRIGVAGPPDVMAMFRSELGS